jgi:hypothetical protein
VKYVAFGSNPTGCVGNVAGPGIGAYAKTGGCMGGTHIGGPGGATGMTPCGNGGGNTNGSSTGRSGGITGGSAGGTIGGIPGGFWFRLPLRVTTILSFFRNWFNNVVSNYNVGGLLIRYTQYSAEEA